MKNMPEELSPFSSRINASRGGGDFARGFDIDYGAYIKRLKKNWYWFLLTLLIGIGSAWLYLRYTVPEYRASASMLVQEQSASGTGLSKEIIADELGFGKSYVVADELYMLKSHRLMERVVNILGLDVTYVHQGKIRNTEIYNPSFFRLFPADSTTARETIRYGSVMVKLEDDLTYSLIRMPGDTTRMMFGQLFNIGSQGFRLRRLKSNLGAQKESVYQISVSDPASKASKYSNKLQVEQKDRSGIVNLSITDQVPQKAKDILDRVISIYGQQNIEEQSKTGKQTVEFLEERLAAVTKELYQVEASAAGFKVNAGMSVDLATRGADYLSQLNEADAQLAELQVRKELIENLRSNLLRDSLEYRTLPVASEVTSGIMSELIQQYNAAVFERDTKLESYTAQHPQLATTDEKLANLKKAILLSISTVLQETTERESRINGRIQPLESNMNKIPENQRRYMQIAREQKIKENLFLFLWQKREEAALSVAAQVPNTRVIDKAMASSLPMSPKGKMIYLFAIGLAFVFPSSAIFLAEILGTTITTENEIKRFSNLPIIGRIVGSKSKKSMILRDSYNTGIGENFRTLRSNLDYLLTNEESSVSILVTSGVPGEGKSFISANLAHSLALAKKRVVMVELDLRRPQLAQNVMGKKYDKKAPGISNYLVDKASYDEIVRPTGIEHLHLIQSGSIPPNPSELLLEEGMNQLFDQLKEDFDILIVDTPPVGIVSDAQLLKDKVDLSLYVVRLGVTPKKSFDGNQEVFRNGKLPRPNLIINGMSSNDIYGGTGYKRYYSN